MSSSSLARAAEWYAARGWPVFPLIPRDKKPLTEHGLKDASTDKIVVGKWWEKEPSANIGVVMGDLSGLFTVDIDGPDGRADWAALEANHEAIPLTVEAETTNGRHLIFKKPRDIEIRNSVSKIGRNIDVRGNGGYIAVAPSVHPSGRPYQWKDRCRPDQIPVAEAPAWLIELVRKRDPEPQQQNGHHGITMDGYASSALANELSEMARTP
jgi:bifunctional DNA primase/polymerase-like protein